MYFNCNNFNIEVQIIIKRYENDQYGVYYYSYLSLTFQLCVQSAMEIGDNVDNDCDGVVDEELCDFIGR